MELLQPMFLWGLLGLSIPLLIHLWNGRQGKTLAWAASRWLPMPKTQTVKGLRLDHWLLLVLRILLILLIILLLGQLFLPSLEKEKARQALHLVQPDPTLVENFRFELTEALNKGDKLFWLNEEMTPIQDLNEANQLPQGSVPLQEAFDRWSALGDSLNIYLLNSSQHLDKVYYSRAEPTLRLYNHAPDNSGQFISLNESMALAINKEGLLVQNEPENINGQHLVWEGQKFPVLVNLAENDSVHIRAALNAITEVYHMDFPDAADSTDAVMVFDGHLPETVDPEKLYFILDSSFFSTYTNIVPFPMAQRLNASGEFPEVILEALLEHIGLDRMHVAPSHSQIKAGFLTIKEVPSSPKANAYWVLWAILIFTFMLERYISMRRGL